MEMENLKRIYDFSLGVSLGVYPTEEIFCACAAEGVRYMELSPHDDDYEKVFANAAQIRKAAEAMGITIRSLHLPFGMHMYNFCAPDAADIKETMRMQKEMLRGAAALGVKYVIAHGGIPLPQTERKKYLAIARENIADLQKAASALGIHVCVESLLPSCIGRNSKELLYIMSAHPDLRVCLDPNHLFDEDHVALIRAVGKKIAAVHFSDYDGLDERHWMPGEGIIDWRSIVAALSEVGYEGPLLYEVNPFRTPKTIDRRALTFEDFRENHAALCRGEIPAPIGKPIEEECRACVFAERFLKNFGLKYEPEKI
jgi:sugar phosphate isomerase/epimerase